jgi:hypothetical protein
VSNSAVCEEHEPNITEMVEGPDGNFYCLICLKEAFLESLGRTAYCPKCEAVMETEQKLCTRCSKLDISGPFTPHLDDFTENEWFNLEQ